MRLEGRAYVVERGGDEDDASAGGGVAAGVLVGLGRLDKVGDGGFKGVVGADQIDIDHRLESVWRQTSQWSEEVTC